MVRAFSIAAAAGCLFATAFTTGASAQVKDATYRGTLVCRNLPFIKDALRSAIEVVISGNSAKYTNPVRMSGAVIAGTESGSGTVEGNKISLKGSWKGEKDSYEASYGGTFVRRSAKLTGVQVWSHEGKTYNRACTGAIKRPLAIFLPRKKSEQ